MNARKKAELHALAVRYLGERRVCRLKIQYPTRWPRVATDEVIRVLKAELERRAERDVREQQCAGRRPTAAPASGGCVDETVGLALPPPLQADRAGPRTRPFR